MKETPRARQAWADYLAMGPGRSLEKLAQEYHSRTENLPTRQLSRLKRWSTRFGWQVRLEEIAETERRALIAKGIADKQNRVDALNDQFGRLRRVIEARATDPLMADIPGGREGVMIAEPMLAKIYGELDDSGNFIPLGKAQLVYRYAVDTGTLKEIRDTMKQAAIEVGEWEEKSKQTLDGTDDFLKALQDFGRARTT